MKYVLVALCIFLVGASANQPDLFKDILDKVLAQINATGQRLHEIIESLNKEEIMEKLKKLGDVKDTNYTCIAHELETAFDSLFDENSAFSNCTAKAENGLAEVRNAAEKLLGEIKASINEHKVCIKGADLGRIISCVGNVISKVDRKKEAIKKAAEKRDVTQLLLNYVNCYLNNEVYEDFGRKVEKLMRKCPPKATHK